LVLSVAVIQFASSLSSSSSARADTRLDPEYPPARLTCTKQCIVINLASAEHNWRHLGV
jgi:hypothetical protein